MDPFIQHLTRLFESLFGSRRRRPASEAQRPLSWSRDERVVAHECGHAGVAWMSPAVLYVDGISFHAHGGATTRVAFNKNHTDYRLDDLVYTLGGLVGEMLATKKAHARGMGGRQEADLPLALKLAESVLSERTLETVERHWRGRLAEPSFDVAAMFVHRPPREVADVLNLAYRRGKRLLNENRAGFDRLRRMAAGRRDLSRDDIASQFGPRPWAPGGR